MKVKVGVLKESSLPWYNNCSIQDWTPRENCLLPGADVEILRELLRAMNSSYEIIATDTLEDLIKLHREGKIDTAAMTLTNSSTINDSLFEFSAPVMFHPYSVTYKLTDGSFQMYLLSLMKPFSPIVWLNIMGLVLLMYSSWILLICKDSLANNKFKFMINSWLEFFTFFQGDVGEAHYIHISIPKKLFFISFSIFSIILSALYQNGLLLSFREGKQEISFSSFSQFLYLLENDIVKLVTNDDTWHFFKRVKDADGEFFERMNKLFLRKPYIKVESSIDVKKYLMNGGYIFIATPFYLQRKYQNELCNLAVVTMDLEKEWSGYIFQKNSTFLPKIDHTITNSWQMINYYLNKYKILDPLHPTCADDKTSQLFALKVKHFSGPLILLTIGVGIGLSTFLFELFKCWRTSMKYITV